MIKLQRRQVVMKAFVGLIAGIAVGCVAGVGWSNETKSSIVDSTTNSAAPIKTLLLTGGPIHNAKDIGDIVQKMLEESGRFEVTRVHEDLDALLPERIAPYKLVVFFWTLGDLTDQQRKGLLDHIAAGNGFTTFHSGADSFRTDEKYREMVGGYFVTHPAYRTYQVSVTNVESPITKGIVEFMITDEQYILNYDPNVNVLANSLHEGKLMPVVWTKPYGEGRVFYSALGHDTKAAEQEMFKTLLLRGALWSVGQE
ncbi:MAG: ThuA domain-containing protein [Planctomycetaceae bacterium]|nr:ThuA domain-containing protein [Planctomycetaceae bacterium]